MRTSELLKQNREEVLRIAARHGVARVRVFGSVARGEDTGQSDLDLLIDVEGPTTPWFPGGLVAELEEALGRRVDVVEPDAIPESMRRQVLKEAVSV